MTKRVPREQWKPMGRPANPFTLEFLMSRAEPDGDCMMWKGTVNSDGYGAIRFSVTPWRAHVAAYTLVHGPVPDGLNVCHTCDRPLCIAPAHLFADTQAGNIADKVSKGRQARGERHGSSKLTADDVRRIREDPRPATTVGKDYSVGQMAVLNIRNGRTWAWLD